MRIGIMSGNTASVAWLFMVLQQEGRIEEKLNFNQPINLLRTIITRTFCCLHFNYAEKTRDDDVDVYVITSIQPLCCICPHTWVIFDLIITKWQ